MPAKVVLEVTSGAIAGRQFPFDAHDTFLFGRHTACHARLTDDPKVSRNHFILEVNPPDANLRDLGSRNGTYINDTKHGGRAADETAEQGGSYNHPAVPLKHGDSIRVGKTTIRMHVYPAQRCRRCGADLGGDAADTVDFAMLCDGCQSLVEVATTQHPATIRPAAAQPPAEQPAAQPPIMGTAVVCSQCGKDAAQEVSDGRRGQYVCNACRGQLVAESDGARSLLRDLLRNARDPHQPAIQGYTIDKKLGEGGMGVVYQAVRESDNQTVAIKLMLARIAVEEAAKRIFAREIDITRQLKHPHVVRLHEHGAQGGAFYFVMDYCSGGSVDQWMAKYKGKLPLKAAGPMMLQILAGLQHAHANKVIHRDLKPQNILLHQADGRWSARISDFGLAKNFEQAGFSGMTATGQMGGTLCFMAREQLTHFRSVQPVSDVWSIAATFYNMLTGQFTRNFRKDVDPVRVILNEEPISIRQRDPSIPQPLAEVIDHALQDDQSKRYQSVAELEAELRRALSA
ncbi:MAG TPA: FHA domain-containing serine/threonine-protein kinase [Pirellulales bacterium]